MRYCNFYIKTSHLYPQTSQLCQAAYFCEPHRAQQLSSNTQGTRREIEDRMFQVVKASDLHTLHWLQNSSK